MAQGAKTWRFCFNLGPQVLSLKVYLLSLLPWILFCLFTYLVTKDHLLQDNLWEKLEKIIYQEVYWQEMKYKVSCLFHYQAIISNFACVLFTIHKSRVPQVSIFWCTLRVKCFIDCVASWTSWKTLRHGDHTVSPPTSQQLCPCHPLRSCENLSRSQILWLGSSKYSRVSTNHAQTVVLPVLH